MLISFALDARTGKTVWDVIVGDSAKGYGSSSGPIVIHGKVIQGENGCDRYKSLEKDRAASSALTTPQTGKQLWRFYTWLAKASRAATPGASSRTCSAAGGETWITGSYDPALNLTYWGVAQPKPWMRASRESGNGAALYASSTSR